MLVNANSWQKLHCFQLVLRSHLLVYLMYRSIESRRLPLGILGGHETLEDTDDLLQAHEVRPELELDLFGVITEFGVEVLAVGTGAHGGTEDGLDDKAVVGLQGGAVGSAKGVGELLAVFGNVGA